MNGWLQVTLLSATCFASGKGEGGEVDIDVDQEPFGLPRIGGKTLKGLLVEECAAILDVIGDAQWYKTAGRLFGDPGAAQSPGILQIGDARLADKVRFAAQNAVTRKEHRRHPLQVLSTLTEIRQQTRIDRLTGAPAETTLRSSRVVRPDIPLYAPLTWKQTPDADDKALLAGCAVMTRRGGLARTRGRGKLKCRCLDERQKDVTREWLSTLMRKDG